MNNLNTMTFVRDWLDAVRNNPEKVGRIFPKHPPITYDMLNEMVAAIDGVPVVSLPTSPPAETGDGYVKSMA